MKDCKDCGAEEALPGIDIGPMCLDILRRSDDPVDKARAAEYQAVLGGKDDPKLVVE